MLLDIGIKQSSSIGFVMLFVIFSAWAVLSVAILILMEGLSAFLHALRLHWYENSLKRKRTFFLDFN
jgi:V-type H+-transporting ATPase subunit a